MGVLSWRKWVCLLLFAMLMLSNYATSAEHRAPSLADNQSDVMTSISLEEAKGKLVSFNIQVAAVPEPRCDGWYVNLGPLRFEKAKRERFNCSKLNDARSDQIHTFNLSIKYPEQNDIGKYGVKFSNDEGEWYFQFEITDSQLLWIIVITSCSLLGACLIFTTCAIVICCTRRARKRRRRRQQQRDNDTNAQQCQEENSEDVLLPSPPPYNQVPEAECSSGLRLKTPLKPGKFQFEEPDRPISATSTRSDLPLHSSCVCGGTTQRQHGKLLNTDEEEIAEAIAATLGRLRAKPTTLNINMYRSRRVSRSVPDLLSLHGKAPHDCDDHDQINEREMATGKLRSMKKSILQKRMSKKTKPDCRPAAAPYPHKQPGSSEQHPHYIHNNSLQICTDDTFFESDDGASGGDVIEVSSTCVRRSADSGDYLPMSERGQVPRDRIQSPRPLGDAPPPCGTSNQAIYENLRGDGGYISAQAPSPSPAPFSYTAALPKIPLMPPGHVASKAALDEDRSTMVSHESTTVRIYKS